MSPDVSDAVLEKLRRGNLNEEITSLVFDHHDRRGTNDAKEEEFIDKLCEGLELLKTNTHIRDLSIHCYLRYDKEEEDTKRVERAYVKFGEYLAVNESVQELNVNVDHLSEAAFSAIAEGLRNNHSVNDLRFYTHDASSITPQGADILANGIRDNHTIRRLNISWPFVSALSHNDTIETVCISGYRISKEGEKALVEVLRDNKTLREIIIDVLGNFEGKTGQMLAEAVASNGSLRNLSIYDWELRGEGIIALAEALQTNRAITDLSLGDILNGPNPGDAATLAIAEMIRHNTAIKTLCVNGRIGEAGIQVIAEALKVNHTIAILSIKDISCGGARFLLEALKENNSLEELVVPNLKPDDEDAKLIAEVLRKNTSLKVLHVPSGTFGDEGGVAIANALGENGSLKTLDIHSNRNLGIEGAKALAEALRVNSSLQALNISSCWGIEDEGAEAILGSLSDNKCLKRLKMWNSHIGNRGIKSLSKALYVNTSLNQLDIGHSNIGVDTVKALAQAIKSNTTLKHIDLRGCLGGDEGGIAIGEALKSNIGLLSIALRNNKLRDRGIIAIAQGLESNNTVRELDISSYLSYNDEDANRMGISGIRAVRKMLETNKSLAILDFQHSFNPASWEVSNLVLELAAGLRNNQTLAELRMAFDREETETFSASHQREFVKALIASNSKNILDIWPDGDGIGEITGGNRTVAEGLLKKIQEHPEELTIPDIRDSEKRLSAIFSCLGKSHRLSDEYTEVEEFYKILETLENREKRIKRETALQLRLETNNRVINDISNYAQHNGLTFEQMCSEIALYRTDHV